jgi:aspartyl-tRNA(Asn)/glutamyl-tRNA(Gln) amidotransferase subunit A
MNDLHWLTLKEASEKIQSNQLSPVEYTKALIQRTENIDPQLNAYIKTTPERALSDAAKAMEAIKQKNLTTPLTGIPYGLKDIIDVKGLITTAHSKILLDNVSKKNSFVTSKLESAGGVFMGKLALHEFAIGGPAFDLPFPPARNPWNTNYHPGGSSSGSGAAVASGMLPAALGTDTGGSVRNPATSCGIVGMKATYGRVSKAGVVPLSFSLDHVGPMTRTVEDNALLLNIIAGFDKNDPSTSSSQPVPDFTEFIQNGVKGLKIGLIRHFYTVDLKAETEMCNAIDKAAETFRKLGAIVEEVHVSPLSHFSSCNSIIMYSEALSIHEKWFKTRPSEYSKATRTRLMPGLFIKGEDYVNALRTRTKLSQEVNNLFKKFDLIMTASSMETACRIDEPETIARTYPRQARTVFNVTGHPACSIPTGLATNGLPLGFQIAGPYFKESLVYQAGWAYEQEKGFFKQHPEI